MLKRSTPLFIMAAILGLILASAAPGSSTRAAQGDWETPPADSVARIQPATKSDSKSDSTSPAMYIVQLQGEPLATYLGGVDDLAATSPLMTGERKLLADSPSSRSYRAYLGRQHATIVDRMASLLGSRVDIRYTYDVAFNGMGVMLTPADAALVAQMPGVVHVQRAVTEYPETDAGPTWIKANGIWDGTATGLYVATILGANETTPTNSNASGSGTFMFNPSNKTLSYNISISLNNIVLTEAKLHRGTPGVDGAVVVALTAGPTTGTYVGSTTLSNPDIALLQGNGLYVNFKSAAHPGGEIRGQITGHKGEGMLVGIIDTGINFGHPSFAARGGDGYVHVNPFGAGHYKGVCNPGEPAVYQPAKVCNDKLVGARTYVKTDVNDNSPEDDDGHGSHTASTVAGNVITDTVLNGISLGTISGVAPHANIIAYDACKTYPDGSSGCPGDALLAAIDAAVADGVDVINYSIGGDSRDPWQDPTALAFLNARAAGIFVSVSAGNSGPGASTIKSPSNAPWVTSVGASTHNRKFVNSLTGLTRNDATTLPDIVGSSLTGSYSSHPIVYAGNYNDNTNNSNNLCGPFAPGTNFAGKIVVCDRGTYGRVEKGQNVLNAGGGGMVLANDSANGNSLVADAHVLPAVHISYNDGVTLKTWLASDSGHMAAISGTSKDLSAANGDVMASFSSRGPDTNVPTVIKPDLAAPGVDVLAAGKNDSNTPAPEFEVLSGTSMAAPHDAGAAVLVRSLHPDWTPAEVQSALMTTSVQASVRKEDGTTAATPYDRGAGRIDVSRAARAGLVLNETKANYLAADPSNDGDPTTLNTASMASPACVRCSWVRVLKSTLATSSSWTASFSAASGVTLSVSPASFTIPAHGQQTITITAVAQTPILTTTVFADMTLTENAARAPSASFPIAVKPTSSALPEGVYIQTRSTSGVKKSGSIAHVAAISPLTVRKYGLIKATLNSTTLPGDPTPDDVYDNLTSAGGVYIKKVTVTTGSKRLVAEITAAKMADADLYVHLDGDHNGVPTENEQVCTSASSTSLEYCSIDAPAAGTYIILVQSFEPSSAPPDALTLATAVVPATDAHNMNVSGPASVAAATPFTVDVGWSVPTIQVGDRWYGGFDLGTDGGHPGNIGFVPVDIQRLENLRVFLPLIMR
jgi:subtilisin family serine protease